jgi:hypothetical protein
MTSANGQPCMGFTSHDWSFVGVSSAHGESAQSGFPLRETTKSTNWESLHFNAEAASNFGLDRDELGNKTIDRDSMVFPSSLITENVRCVSCGTLGVVFSGTPPERPSLFDGMDITTDPPGVPAIGDPGIRFGQGLVSCPTGPSDREGQGTAQTRRGRGGRAPMRVSRSVSSNSSVEVVTNNPVTSKGTFSVGGSWVSPFGAQTKRRCCSRCFDWFECGRRSKSTMCSSCRTQSDNTTSSLSLSAIGSDPAGLRHSGPLPSRLEGGLEGPPSVSFDGRDDDEPLP